MGSSTVTMATAKIKKSRKSSHIEAEPVPDPVPASPPLDPDTVIDDESDNEEATAEDASPSSSSKKRKRDSNTNPEELEIDVTLPEPPSKKALRRAKKNKPTSTNPTSDSASTGMPLDSDDEQSAAPVTATTYGIWIGNLPFAATKPLLRTFLTSSGTITEGQITRVHMPPPAHAAASRTHIKPLNKGFAYVDFIEKSALDAALALSESEMGGRRVLIKDSKSFEGRPEKSKVDETAGDGKAAAGQAKGVKKPSKRVFVGNLGFDVTKEDLMEHYAKCGGIADVHMATFEDSGKCKGYAWVTFEEGEAAESAVRGWLKLAEPDSDSHSDAEEDDKSAATADDEPASDDHATTTTAPNTKKEKKQKSRKWFVNRLQGRPLRCEFAEDPTSRYKKRFGKDPAKEADAGREPAARREKRAPREGIEPGAPTDAGRRRAKGRSAAAAPEARYRTGVITEATGNKVSFD